jgi:hypothetical protein
LARIREDAGALTAEGVFVAAMPEDAVLHGEFEWDGQKAIRELGLIRARNVIRSVVVRNVESDEAPHRVYTHIVSESPGQRAGVYEPMTVVVQSPDLYERALTNLQRKFDAAAESLEELRALASASGQPDRLAAIGLAVQGFGAVREALALLK